jgi:hypothetical protein
MPRYFFDVREGRLFVEDRDGQEFPSVDEAEQEAIEAAASIGKDRLPRGDTRDVTVEVRNERRQRVLTVRVELHIDRVHPAPE